MGEEESRGGASQGDGAAAGCEGDGVSTARRPDAAGRPRVLLRSVLRISVAVMVVVAVLAAGASIWAWTISAGHIEIAGESRGDGEATRAPVAIVLGAAVDADGRPSPWLAHRLDTAAELYTSGRVEAILVSGDNRRAGYDEPTVMRRYLLSQGIPDQAIAVDYAGFDTYDTCVRARRIFGIERALLVTQDFHEPRAVAICRSVGVDADGVTLKHKDGTVETVPSQCKVWAAGVQASELGKALADATGAEVDRAGRVVVDKDLTVPGHPEIFVIGDLMSVPGVPGVAQGAIQSGRYVAQAIRRRLRGKEPQGPFTYRDKGSMATISRYRAVVKIRRLEVSGFVAWQMWCFLHLLYIVGFKNQFSTLMDWFFSFISGRRTERTVTNQQMVARLALETLGG